MSLISTSIGGQARQGQMFRVTIFPPSSSALWIFSYGVYELSVTMDDGARVYVDGHLVIDTWSEGALRTPKGAIGFDWFKAVSRRLL